MDKAAVIEALVPVYGRREAIAMAEWIAEEPEGTYNLSEVIARLLKNEPLQYIFGHTDWRGIRLELSADTLIPRPETSELVDEVLRLYSAHALQGPVLDICTGSGCIPIALAKKQPSMPLFACDIAEGALQTAVRNAQNNNVSVTFFQQDILSTDAAENIRRQTGCKSFDIIVANPPYICQAERAEMEPNVLDFEPALALFVPDTDPLLFYRAIARLRLAPVVCFEINRRFGQQTADLLRQEGYPHTRILTDMFGEQRILIASQS